MDEPLTPALPSEQSPDSGSSGWPKSFKVYRVRNVFEIVAHSEEQAKKRFDDLMTVLSELAIRSEYPHEVVRYVRNTGDIEDIEFAFEEVCESWSEVGVSMLSNMEYLWDWWDPNSDADYDPCEAARKLLGEEDEEE